MNEPMIFNSPEFGKVRAVEIDGEPWLVGKDVAQALGYSNHRKALDDHVDYEDKMQGDGVTIRDSIGREQHPTIINESGLYSLIFSSKLPDAKKFKHWVTSEVLPSIRKTGGYAVPTTEKTLADLTAAVALLTERLDTMLAAREIPLSVLPALPEPEGEMGQVPGIAARRRWMRTVSEKLDMLSTKIHQPHNICLHQVYQILEDRFWRTNGSR